MMWARSWSRRLLAGGAAFSSVAMLSGFVGDPLGYKVERFTKTPDGVLVARQITTNADKTNLNLRLYQYQACPFCCKVRAFLDYYGFSYEVVEVNPVTKTQLKFAPHCKKVPVITAANGGQVLTESSLIISILATFMQRENKSFAEVLELFPEVPVVNGLTHKTTEGHPNKYFVMVDHKSLSDEQLQSAREEREWREWVDDHFVHLISPNVYRTWGESVATFRWFSESAEWERNFSTVQRLLAIYVGAAAMLAVSKRLMKRHGITDPRASLFDACDQWVRALGNRPFMGGKSPNLADLALFGAMNSFVGCAAFDEMLANGRIREWHERMRLQVDGHRGSPLLERKRLPAVSL